MLRISTKPTFKFSISAACALFFAASLVCISAQENAAKTEVHGISIENMDRTVVPGDDFYLYANGGWIQRTEIPPDRPNIGVFSRLSDIANKRMADLIAEAAKSQAPAGSSERQIADLYNSFMKEDAIEARGLAPLQTHLEHIRAIKTKRDLARALGETLRADVDALNNTNFHTSNLFGLWTAPGFNDSDHYAAYLLQGGLELPDREYYLADTPHMREVREKYKTHISAMLKLAGFTDTDARAEAMVANIVEAFRKRIDALTWMAPATKAEAKAKLATLYVGIGYPEHWHDYSGLEIKADDLFGNLWRGNLFEYHRQVKRLGSTVDRQEWSMSPQTVNAVNLPLQNALNFPAAILEPPFFDPKAPDAVNYGAIGSVIGHEISHTFDSEGAAFDAKGRVRNWWTEADLAHFNAATAKLAAQYDTYKPFPDLSLNGRQTLAENIADVAGVSAAYDGYRASLAGKPAPQQDGFSGDQQFFIAFGQNWGSKEREAALRRQIMTDSHSPGQYRAATVRNIDAWYPAFDVKPGQKLFLTEQERVKIW